MSKKDLKEKILRSKIFMILGTRNYLESLRNLDGDILTQIAIAEENKKPFFLLLHKDLTPKEKDELINYFSRFNVIKTLEFDINDPESTKTLAKEIAKLAGNEENIKITSSIEDYD